MDIIQLIQSVLNSDGNFITSLAAVLTALGAKELVLDRFHRKDYEEDRESRQVEVLTELRKGYDSNKKLIEDLSTQVNSVGHKVAPIEEKVSSLTTKLSNLQDAMSENTSMSVECDLAIFRERLYYMMTLATKRGERISTEHSIVENMFSLYTKLGGNGDIKALHEVYTELPMRQGSISVPEHTVQI